MLAAVRVPAPTVRSVVAAVGILRVTAPPTVSDCPALIDMPFPPAAAFALIVTDAATAAISTVTMCPVRMVTGSEAVGMPPPQLDHVEDALQFPVAAEVHGFGTCAPMMKVCAADVPPPGVGFTTVTAAVVEVVRSDVRIAAVSDELETNVVVRELPFHWTWDVEIKLLPVSVSVNPKLPAVVELGEMAVRTGNGFGGPAKTACAPAKNRTAAVIAKKILFLYMNLALPCEHSYSFARLISIPKSDITNWE